MPVAVIAISMLVTLLATPSAASPSCMSKAEARQHFTSLHIYWHGQGRCWDATAGHRLPWLHRVRAHRRIHQVRLKIDPPKWRDSMSRMASDGEPAQASPRTAWADRWVDIEPAGPARRIDIAAAGTPSIVADKAAPMISPNLMLALITVAIATTLATIEFLFRRTV